MKMQFSVYFLTTWKMKEENIAIFQKNDFTIEKATYC